jgi:chemotaxis protein histidine kinase CheA
VRKAAGKSDVGQIVISVSRSSAHVELEVRDDGAGIDSEGLRKKALELGILSSGQNPTPGVLNELLYQPGLSIKTTVTEISGRGVGMDVVRSNIEKLAGKIEFKTSPGEGTTFKISLPF